MKPKTQLQIEVDKLSRRLPKVTKTHSKWASDNLFKSYVYRLKNTHTCFECGHSWDVSNEPALAHILDEYCPKCKRKLEATATKVRKIRDVNYYSMITTFDRFQIVRYFHVTKHWKLGEKPYVWINEVVQHWITPEGKNIIRGLSTCMNSWGYNDGWAFGSDMAIRSYGKLHEYNSNKYFINPQGENSLYPKPTYLKELRRNGFKGSTHGYNPAWFFTLLLSTPAFETLLKAKQYSLLKHFDNNKSKIEQYWPSIKIRMRHKYIVKDAINWLDHLPFMLSFGMDIRNPKYICSPTFKEDHQKLITRRQIIEDKESYEKQQKIKAEREAMLKAMMKTRTKLSNIKFSNGVLDLVVLKTIEDFKTEGEVLHHCVYASKYHEKPDSLIMSARINGRRIATIEISLTQMRVVQCRGNNNNTPEQYDEIVKLVNDNMKIIRKTYKNVA